MLGVLVLARLDSVAQTAERTQHQAGVQTAADFAAGFVSDRIRLQRQRAQRYLSGPRVSPADLEWAGAGLGYSVVAATDGRGRLLAVTPPAPELIGRDVTASLGHVGISVRSGRPGIATVVSPVLHTPVVGIAVPFDTPYGRRVFSGGLSLQDSPLRSGMERTATRLHERVRLIDAHGNLVAASDDPGGRVTSLAEQAPELAAALAERPSGSYRVGEEERFYDSAPVEGTDWRAVASVAERTLYGDRLAARWASAGALTALSIIGLGAVAFVGSGNRRQALTERHIRLLNEQLQQSSKDLQEFTYSVAHDLRAPLRAMSGFSQIVMRRYGDHMDEPGRDYMRRIDAAGRKMGALIDDLLDLSRVARTELRVEAVDLSAIAHLIEERLREHDPERMVTFTIVDGVIAPADRELITTMLGNLIGNAWKFTARRQDAEVEFGTTEAGPGQIGCYVRDNGAGFDPAYADSLFKPFQRLHGTGDYPGAGIGLASARRIIERHGGRIWAEGSPEAGATFYFTLPATAAPDMAVPGPVHLS